MTIGKVNVIVSLNEFPFFFTKKCIPQKWQSDIIIKASFASSFQVSRRARRTSRELEEKPRISRAHLRWDWLLLQVLEYPESDTLAFSTDTSSIARSPSAFARQIRRNGRRDSSSPSTFFRDSLAHTRARTRVKLPARDSSHIVRCAIAKPTKYKERQTGTTFCARGRFARQRRRRRWRWGRHATRRWLFPCELSHGRSRRIPSGTTRAAVEPHVLRHVSGARTRASPLSLSPCSTGAAATYIGATECPASLPRSRWGRARCIVDRRSDAAFHRNPKRFRVFESLWATAIACARSHECPLSRSCDISRSNATAFECLVIFRIRYALFSLFLGTRDSKIREIKTRILNLIFIRKVTSRLKAMRQYLENKSKIYV